MAQGNTREWDVPLEQPELNDEREGSSVTAVVPVDNFGLANELLAEAAQIVLRLGGVVAISAHRVEYEKGKFATTGLAFRWDSYGGPATRIARQQPEAQNGAQARKQEPVEGESVPRDESDELDAVEAAAHVPG